MTSKKEEQKLLESPKKIQNN